MPKTKDGGFILKEPRAHGSMFKPIKETDRTDKDKKSGAKKNKI